MDLHQGTAIWQNQAVSKIVFKDTKHRTKIMEDKHLSRK